MKVTVTKENESVIYNGTIYSHGQSFDVDDAIGKSLMERGYVSDASSDAASGGNLLETLSYPELKKLAAEKGVAATGKKEDLIARILAAEAEDEYEADEEQDAAEDEEPKAAEDESEADELPNTSMPD